ncbi:MAG: alpha/beta hydrolase [Chthoniobacteraceae bacterium]
MEPVATLVLLPGLDGTDVFFRPLLALLPSSIQPRVIVFPTPNAGGYDELLQFVREVTADLPEFTIFASSFSGPLAIMLAAVEPERVKGIILCSTFVRAPKPGLPRYRFAMVPPVVWTLRAMRRLPVWLRRRDDPLRVAKAETWSRVSAQALAERGRAILEVDVRETLQNCPQPVLCLDFADDQVVPRHNAEEICQLHLAATMVTLPGGHFGMFTHPGPVAEQVVSFIGANSKNPRPSINHPLNVSTPCSHGPVGR